MVSACSALPRLLAESGLADNFAARQRSLPRPIRCRCDSPQYAARAKRVIFLFMSGGPSHVDLFDPKPLLTRDTGKPLPIPDAGPDADEDRQPAWLTVEIQPGTASAAPR